MEERSDAQDAAKARIDERNKVTCCLNTYHLLKRTLLAGSTLLRVIYNVLQAIDVMVKATFVVCEKFRRFKVCAMSSLQSHFTHWLFRIPMLASQSSHDPM